MSEFTPKNTEQCARETLAGLWAEIGTLTDQENDGNLAAWEMAQAKAEEAAYTAKIAVDAIKHRNVFVPVTATPAQLIASFPTPILNALRVVRPA